MSPTSGRIAVVVGSTRPRRICPGIARWLQSVTQEKSPLAYEILDLAEVALPFLDEPLMAALGEYEHEHTRAWSRTVSSFDGFLFVFPQYNWGYPGVLKNALDFLYAEWAEKPASFLTYGTRGGSQAAAQFRSVLTGLHLRLLESHLEVIITRDDVNDEWQLRDVEAVMAPYRDDAKLIDAQMTAALTLSDSWNHADAD